MPKIKEVSVTYQLGCSVQPKAFHSLTYQERGTFTLDVSDTDGSVETAKKLYEETRAELECVIEPTVAEFWETAGGTRDKEV